MPVLKIIAGLFVLVGFVTVLGSKFLVNRFGLDRKVKIEHESEMDEEETARYKQLKASVNVKIVGMLIAAPGIILTLIVFR